MEEWKVAVESYEVSNFGNVRKRLLKGGSKELKCSVLNSGEGYKYFQLFRDGKRKNILVHHLVAKMFIGERPDGLVIDHIDRNSLNNNVENLRYVSQQKNCYNTDNFRTDVPEDTPNRRLVLNKLNYQTNDYGKRKKEKLPCQKCNKLMCRAYLPAHMAKCDGSGVMGKKGRKVGDKSCILNLKKRTE